MMHSGYLNSTVRSLTFVIVLNAIVAEVFLVVRMQHVLNDTIWVTETHTSGFWVGKK